MLNWIIDAGTIASYRLSGSEVFLGFLDNVYFVNPVKIGGLLIYRCWIPRTGRSSIDTYVEAMVRDRATGALYLSSVSKMIFVAVDEHGRPKMLKRRVVPEDDWEDRLHRYFAKWHDDALNIVRRYKGERDHVETRFRYQIESIRRVTTEDTFLSDVMYAGSLMLHLDEIAAIMASTYAEGNVVTASVDQMIFVEPIRINEYIKIIARVTRTWRTSMEIGVDVWSLNGAGAKRKLKSYFTFVRVGVDGRPEPLRQYSPHSVEEIEEWEGAERRRNRRLLELKNIQRYKSLDLSGRISEDVPIALNDLLTQL
jgi:acyl-CoA hydrolase